MGKPRIVQSESQEYEGSIVVGIDQSYSGFGLTFMSKAPSPLVYSTVLRAFPPTGSVIERLLQVKAWLTETLLYMSCVYYDAVAMEDYAYGGSQMAHMLGELGGLVKTTVFETIELEPILISTSALKKYVSGSGATKKNAMLMATYKKWGIEFWDDNMADSFGLAHAISGRAKLAYELDVVKKLGIS